VGVFQYRTRNSNGQYQSMGETHGHPIGHGSKFGAKSKIIIRIVPFPDGQVYWWEGSLFGQEKSYKNGHYGAAK
jgi:hypothetical protein